MEQENQQVLEQVTSSEEILEETALEAAEPVLAAPVRRKKKGFFFNIWKFSGAYLMILPAIVVTIIFAYLPMYGIIMAFKNFHPVDGILGSPWAANYGFEHFLNIFRDPEMLKAVKNTIVFGSPAVLPFVDLPSLFGVHSLLDDFCKLLTQRITFTIQLNNNNRIINRFCITGV